MYRRYHSLPHYIRAASWITIPLVTLVSTISYIEYNKQVSIQSNYYEFFPGSTDEILSHTLKTGDLLLFNHRIIDTKLTKIFLNILNKFINKSSYDHIGVVIYDDINERPMVLEYGYNGIRLTNYDERILLSRCNEIDLKRLSPDYYITPQLQHQLNQYIQQSIQQQNNNTTPLGTVCRSAWNLMKYSAMDYLTSLSIQSKRYTQYNQTELQHKKYNAIYYMYELQSRIDKLQLQYKQQCQQNNQHSDTDCELINNKLIRLHNQLQRAELQTKQIVNKLSISYDNNKSIDKHNIKYNNAALVTQILQFINIVPAAYNDSNSLHKNQNKLLCFNEYNNDSVVNDTKYCVDTSSDIPYITQYSVSNYVNDTIPLLPDIHYQRSIPIITPYKSNQTK